MCIKDAVSKKGEETPFASPIKTIRRRHWCRLHEGEHALEDLVNQLEYKEKEQTEQRLMEEVANFEN